MSNNHNYAVVVAGGKGTRLWPMSREELPKQLHALAGEKSLLEQTVERISGTVPYERIFISTTAVYAEKIASMLPDIPRDNIIIEPEARGTTAAFALFAETIRRRDPKATIFSLASDHAVSKTELFHQAMLDAYEFVNKHPKSVALVGITPTEPDTGLGYIKIDKKICDSPLTYSVEKFVEKPTYKVAKLYVESGDYYWNAAYYCFKASTLVEAYHEADPAITDGVNRYLETGKSEDFQSVPIKPQEIEIINANRFPLAMVPASFEWSDIGNWSSLHDLMAQFEDDTNMVVSSKQQHIDVDSHDCMVMLKDKKKIIATVGLSNIVIVDTEDALLVMEKSHTQDIKAVLETIKDRGLEGYL